MFQSLIFREIHTLKDVLGGVRPQGWRAVRGHVSGGPGLLEAIVAVFSQREVVVRATKSAESDGPPTSCLFVSSWDHWSSRAVGTPCGATTQDSGTGQGDNAAREHETGPQAEGRGSRIQGI